MLGVMTAYAPKITFGKLRSSGVRDVLIDCRDHRCSHRVADRWGDHLRLRPDGSGQYLGALQHLGRIAPRACARASAV